MGTGFTDLPILAIVVPCYNEELLLEKTAQELLNVLNLLIEQNLISNQSYISFTDDGSRDSSWKIIKELTEKHNQIRGIRLAFNAGHQKVLLCGMTENNADIYITLDCDLQDDINIIPEMIKTYKDKNLDIVYTVRKNRKTDSFFKKFFANAFYAILPLFGIKHIPNCADYRLVSSNVVNVLRQIKESNLYLRGMLFEYNFKYEILYYDRKKRSIGDSKYTFLDSFNLAINAILNSSLFPIRFLWLIGLFVLVFAFIQKSSFMILSALNFMAIALVGEYLGRMFNETKKRPNFVIKERTDK